MIVAGAEVQARPNPLAGLTLRVPPSNLPAEQALLGGLLAKEAQRSGQPELFFALVQQAVRERMGGGGVAR